MRDSNAAEQLQEKWQQDDYPPEYNTAGYDPGTPETEIISLQAERENFFYNPELYLELALQDIEYQYSRPEYYLAVISAWVKPLSYHSSVRTAIREMASDFLRRTLSNTSRSFAFALLELGSRQDKRIA